MSWISNFAKWWNKNVIRHGEDNDISDKTGLSENDMSKPLSDADWRRYTENTLSSPLMRFANNRQSYRDGFKDKDWSLYYKNSARNIATGVLLGLGIPALRSRSSSSDNSSAESLAIQALNNVGANISDGSNSRSQNGFWNSIKSFFSGDGSFSLNLNGLTSALTGIGSQYANSVLNYENQVKLIDKQNEYNTPANQMARFNEAGLNPNLIYGLGSNGNQPASGSVAPVDFDTSQRENRLARMQIQTQFALAKADIASKMADVSLKEKQANNVDESTIAQRLANDTYLEGFKNQQNLLIAQYEKLIQEKREAMANADSAEARAMYANDIARLEMEIKDAEQRTAETIAKYSEANQITGAIGNIFGVNLGLGLNWSRSRTGLLPIYPYK